MKITISKLTKLQRRLLAECYSKGLPYTPTYTKHEVRAIGRLSNLGLIVRKEDKSWEVTEQGKDLYSNWVLSHYTLSW